MIRAGSGEPLVLLHGVLGGPEHWRHLMPMLARRHDTIALAALGHAGRPAPQRRPATIIDVIDDIERQLDELGFDTVHVAGNSMGGWIALELARRGRARSVCALSPGGAWTIGAPDHSHAGEILNAMVREGELGRPLRALGVRVPALRRRSLRFVAEHGDRLTPSYLLDLVRESDPCELLDELLEGEFALEPMDPLPCPLTIAWAELDQILPLATNGARARELFPGATFTILHGIGHVPMFDDPALVARTILQTTA